MMQLCARELGEFGELEGPTSNPSGRWPPTALRQPITRASHYSVRCDSCGTSQTAALII
jgi:hypothetical protein